MNFYEVVLPTLNSPIKNIFTYSHPNKLNLGDFVKVELRKNEYRGIIIEKVKKPQYPTKDILEIIAPNLLVDWQIQLFKYINEYYFANPSKTINLFLPNKILKNKTVNLKTPNKENSFLNKLPKTDTNKHTLNSEQAEVLKNIQADQKRMHLLHGVTGSGKTEIYLQVIEETIKANKQVLILVPEISLSSQTANYFSNYFGTDLVGIFHSNLSSTEQMLEWKRIKDNQCKIIIGSRSALFLPFTQLEYIIMDEEHEFAYKQDQNPRYHARTIVQWMHKYRQTKIILGSATPSLESYFAAKERQVLNYHLLSVRAKKTPLPKIEIVDLKNEYKNKNFSLLSERLQDEIEEHLKNKEQIMILHNKRGFASFLQCTDCGEVVECPNCSISLTLHHKHNQEVLQCHYCDYQAPNPNECQSCHGHNLKTTGAGIQKVIEQIEYSFPSARILQADSDTTKTKHSFNEIYQSFKNHEADILIGTQMISKGINIPNVQLAAVINADIGLHLPDFRASERSFQLLTQLAGRAGRNLKQGHVIIQTLNPMHPVIQAVAHNNLKEFYAEELTNRQKYSYPPFQKLTKLIFADTDHKKVAKASFEIEKALEKMKVQYKSAPALLEKRHNKYYHHILISSLKPEAIIAKLKLNKTWQIDRDPISTI